MQHRTKRRNGKDGRWADWLSRGHISWACCPNVAPGVPPLRGGVAFNGEGLN